MDGLRPGGADAARRPRSDRRDRAHGAGLQQLARVGVAEVVDAVVDEGVMGGEVETLRHEQRHLVVEGARFRSGDAAEGDGRAVLMGGLVGAHADVGDGDFAVVLAGSREGGLELMGVPDPHLEEVVVAVVGTVLAFDVHHGW